MRARTARVVLAALALVLLAPVCLASPAQADLTTLTGLAPVLLEAGPADAPAGRAAEASATRAAFRAAKARVRGISLVPSASKPHWLCPESSCEAIADPAPKSVRLDGRERYALPDKEGAPLEGGGVHGGYDPQDLQSAYEVSASGGADQTVALVDAYGYSEAEEDLAVYRKKYGLPPCTKADGCFRKINQLGEEANYPADEEGWDGEAALDLDMVSAMCPECHIMLAEATEPLTDDLEETVDSAVRLGATEVSNSYGGPETEREADGAAYDQPGVMIFASAGDDGYDNHERGWEAPNFPAALPDVIAVGGTNLRKASNTRGWEDTVWSGSGSGCSKFVPKPVWQHDPGCAKRMSDDVAAVASCATPVSTYLKSWELVCGTSVSSPLVAGIEAHASAYVHSLPGADAFYDDPGGFFDVTSGSNGTCTPPESHAYYCNAQEGYDGPSGNGVPDGPITRTQAPPVVVTSPEVTLSGSTATLSGEVDPQGQEASYRFEYGTGGGYTNSAPVPEGTLQAGTETRQVSVAVEGVQPDSAYHFRLAATSPAGTSYGSDYQFSTAAPVVSGVSPGVGPPDGNTTVTISGSNFQGATAVRFGSHEAQSFVVESPQTISAVSPIGTGTDEISVITAAGTSQASPDSLYAYAHPGPVLAWGDNDDLLGDGQTAASSVPVEVSGLGEAVGLAAGSAQSLALLGDGRVMAWGRNSGGGVGDGTLQPKATPVPVCAPEAKKGCSAGPYLEEVVQVASGAWYSVALLRDGRVLTWGYGPEGQLGRGKGFLFEIALSPKYVCKGEGNVRKRGSCTSGDYLEEVVQIAAAGSFAAALLRNGTVMTWGENAQGQLGTGRSRGPESCESEEELEDGKFKKVACSTYPVEVAGLTGVAAIAAGGEENLGNGLGEPVSPGGSHALALLDSGTVMAWGQNANGEVGDGTLDERSSPVAVCAAGERAPCAQRLEGVSAVAAGEGTSMALLKNGSVFDWGREIALGEGFLYGPEQCAPTRYGYEHCSTVPVAPNGLPPVRTIASGGNTDLAVGTEGEIYTWGSNFQGRLGIGEEAYAWSPARVCAAFNEGPCPGGPYLEGNVTAVSEGEWDVLIGFEPGHGLVEHVSPESGPGAGGTSVAITGRGLSGATGVYFGTTPASSFEARSDSEVIATAPAGAGSVDVRVTTPEGETPVRLGDRYSYEDSTVTSISPTSGAPAGGTAVTITGTKLAGAREVYFGTTPAAEFEALSETEILAISPAGHGVVDVSVLTPEGTSVASEADRFTYVSAPEVTTAAASDVRESSAILSGSWSSSVGVKSCSFEYGLSEAYERSQPCVGIFVLKDSQSIRGLTAGTTYHYRLAVTNSVGTGYGSDETFTTATSGLPELGRCVKVDPATGRFTAKTCTTTSAGEDSGDYEWNPGPGTHPAFTGSGGSVSITQGSAGELTCPASRYQGSYTGAQSAVVELTLGGCGTLEQRSAKCHSEGAGEGEIVSNPLLMTLGPVSEAKTPVVGWELAASPPAAIVTFTCAQDEQIVLRGAVIGTVKHVDRPESAFTLLFELAHKSDAQAVDRFEGGLTDELWSFRSGTISSRDLLAAVPLDGEEPLEIKAAP